MDKYNYLVNYIENHPRPVYFPCTIAPNFPCILLTYNILTVLYFPINTC